MKDLVVKSLLIGLAVLVLFLVIPIEVVPQAPDAAEHEFPSATTFGLKAYGFPLKMYWKYGYASYTDLLTEEMAIQRGGDVYWGGIVADYLIYTVVAGGLLAMLRRRT